MGISTNCLDESSDHRAFSFPHSLTSSKRLGLRYSIILVIAFALTPFGSASLAADSDQLKPVPPQKALHLVTDKSVRQDENASECDKRLAYIVKRVKQHWCPSRSFQSCRTLVVFKIGPDGTASDIKVAYKHGASALAEQTAVQAVEWASPFSPRPAECASETVELDFRYLSPTGLYGGFLD
jgi:hypothetical protein